MRNRLSLLVPLACVLALALPAAAEEKKAEPKPAGPDSAAMMKAWEAYMTPGAPHQRLAKSAGTWTARVKNFMDPSKPPEESEGTSVNTMILGGRFLEQRFEGKMMGQPFSGVGVTGYDNARKKYEGFWVDSLGTGMMIMSGTLDKSGKKLTAQGRMQEPTPGKTVAVKGVTTFVDDDHEHFEMWMTGPDGKMAKTLEIDYTRKK